jgi:hypothetical protein
MGILEFCVSHQLPVIRQKVLQLIDAAGNTFGGYLIFIRQSLDRKILAPQAPKKDLQHPVHFRIFHLVSAPCFRFFTIISNSKDKWMSW